MPINIQTGPEGTLIYEQDTTLCVYWPEGQTLTLKQRLAWAWQVVKWLVFKKTSEIRQGPRVRAFHQGLMQGRMRYASAPERVTRMGPINVNPVNLDGIQVDISECTRSPAHDGPCNGTPSGLCRVTQDTPVVHCWVGGVRIPVTTSEESQPQPPTMWERISED